MDAMTGPTLRTIPFKVTDPQRIPAARYHDEEFFKLEAEHLWPRVWQMACRLEEIPELGDWVEYQILKYSVIIVNTRNGIKAFHNACRHRGVRLANGHGNCKSEGFICPFHGWRWNMEGANTFVYGRKVFDEANLEAAELNLVPCRIEFWGGCAFINFDDDAAPLLDTIKPAADCLNPRNIEKLKSEWWLSTVLPTNWKIAMEGFMEGYHVMKTHPQLYGTPVGENNVYGFDAGGSAVRASLNGQEMIDVAVHHMELLSAGMGGMVHANDIAIAHDLLREGMELPENAGAALGTFFRHWNEEVTVRGRARGVPMPDLNDLAKNNPAPVLQFVFPHYFLLPMFGNMAAYRIRPLSPETCLFELWSLVLYPEGEKRPRPVAPTPVPHDSQDFPEVPRQDYSNLPKQQLGLHAKGFEYMRLSKNVEGLISNYNRVIDGFLEGVSKDALTIGMRVACGALDTPIAEIGF
jgi:phenylpropionate dioxygenase-like ring-hydroxylating dioxygenase large terminal subunit